MPLSQALERITSATGRQISADPDAVAGKTSAPVNGATSAEEAVRRATSGLRVAVYANGDRVVVANDIAVTARRDEAKTNVLVRSATTSTRTGLSLRDQPRNAQVLSARLIAEQQSQTLADTLRNAGGVSMNNGTTQGGATFGVRGYSGASSITNGLNTNGNGTGASQPLVNIERDALLAGVSNLGGTFNIVTKKPSADTLIYGI